MILLIDNYDSFVHNLARYFRQLGVATEVVRNDALADHHLNAHRPAAIVISPGPCTPDEAGQSLELVRRWQGVIPILGICLGHQVIVQALGGQVVRSSRPCHGEASDVWHTGESVFRGMANPFKAGRYHSLIAAADRLPQGLRLIAHLDDGTVMGVANADGSLVGLQFHPESVLTEHGYLLLANFLKQNGIPCPSDPARSQVFAQPSVQTENLMDRAETSREVAS